MSEQEEISETYTVAHSANGATSVTCIIVDGKHTIRWSVKCFESSIKVGVENARAGALRALDQLKEAVVATWAA